MRGAAGKFRGPFSMSGAQVAGLSSRHNIPFPADVGRHPSDAARQSELTSLCAETSMPKRPVLNLDSQRAFAGQSAKWTIMFESG